MKKIIFSSLVTFIVIHLFSCNDSGNENSSSTGTDSVSTNRDSVKNNLNNNPKALNFLMCTGSGNFIISKTDAENMIKNFRSIYTKLKDGTPIKTYVDSAWIDAAILTSFSDSLNASTLDGITFFFCASQKDSTNVILVPTYDSSGYHETLWDSTIPVNIKNAEFSNYNLGHKKGWPLVKQFRKKYREEKIPGDLSSGIRDSLSASVWFDECAINYLSDLIKDPSNSLDGVRVYFGAYNKMDPAHHPGQFRTNQSTLILVPTSADGIKHNNRYDVIKRLIDKFTSDDNSFKLGALNHGELCPQKCN